MKPTKHFHQLKILTLCAAAAAAGLRAAHYGFGTDGRGLLVANHWSVIGLWVVSAGFAVMLLLSAGSIKCPKNPAKAFPDSISAAVGCFVLAAGLVITSLQQFAHITLAIELLVWILGLLAAAGALITGICRMKRMRPSFLIYTVLCLFITLRMILQYRNWSADPQLQDYIFYLFAHVALMLTSYHHGAVTAGLKNHRALWICSLCAVYLCCAALPHCSEALLMGCCAFWALTNLPALSQVGRYSRPASQKKGRLQK